MDSKTSYSRNSPSRPQRVRHLPLPSCPIQETGNSRPKPPKPTVPRFPCRVSIVGSRKEKPLNGISLPSSTNREKDPARFQRQTRGPRLEPGRPKPTNLSRVRKGKTCNSSPSTPNQRPPRCPSCQGGSTTLSRSPRKRSRPLDPRNPRGRPGVVKGFHSTTARKVWPLGRHDGGGTVHPLSLGPLPLPQSRPPLSTGVHRRPFMALWTTLTIITSSVSWF